MHLVHEKPGSVEAIEACVLWSFPHRWMSSIISYPCSSMSGKEPPSETASSSLLSSLFTRRPSCSSLFTPPVHNKPPTSFFFCAALTRSLARMTILCYPSLTFFAAVSSSIHNLYHILKYRYQCNYRMKSSSCLFFLLSSIH